MPLFLLGIFFTSCSKDDVVEEVEEKNEKVEQPVEAPNVEVEDFIFSAMNLYYLYEARVPEFANSFFKTEASYIEFLASFEEPEDLYYDLVVESHDRFSFMHHDYEELNNLLNSGIAKSTGMDYKLHRFSSDPNKVFGYVRYVLPNSSASEKGIKRGDFFTEVDGQELTLSNYSQLLNQDSYSLRISTMQENIITPTNKVVDLVNAPFTEDPVHITRVFEIEGKKIGYLMYNSFTPSFDAKLNSAFAEFESENISDLILDLRYNSGGDGETASDLGSMITGQFEGEPIMKLQYNNAVQAYYQANIPSAMSQNLNSQIRTGEKIHSLGLSEVHIITTKSSASASEVVINGLRPFIKVVQVGDFTSGKYQGSYTLVDSPNYFMTDKDGNVHVNPNHRYVIQPIVVKYTNKDGFTDFVDGLEPDITIYEQISNLGVLGDLSEPLLEAAVNSVLGKPQQAAASSTQKMAEQNFGIPIGESDMFLPNYQRLYLDPPRVEFNK